MDLTGTYQLKNVLTVARAIMKLRDLHYHISDEAVFAAMRNVKKITGLKGRWQTLHKSPLTICDTGHNLAGIKEVLQNIKNTPHQHLHMVFGVLKDKDVNAVLAILPKQATYYFSQPHLDRALPAAELAQQAKKYELHGEVYPEIKKALKTAQHHAKADDLIFIGGSTFVVAEVI